MMGRSANPRRGGAWVTLPQPLAALLISFETANMTLCSCREGLLWQRLRQVSGM